MITKDYSFKGKHAQYVKEMVDSRDNIGIFKRNIDVFLTAPLIGLFFDRKSEIDKDSFDTKIFYEVIAKEMANIEFVYEEVMLCMQSKDPMISIDMAFKEQSDHEKMKENFKVFEKYLLGGIEVLYENLFQKSNSREELIYSILEFSELLNEKIANFSNETQVDYDQIIKEILNGIKK